MDPVKLEQDLKQIVHYINVDLDDMECLKKACFPILMTVSSGIDFVGGLLIGFNRSNGDRYAAFVTQYMVQINPEYSKVNLASYLYKFLRCKIAHEACISGDIITKNADDFKDLHLTQKDYSGKICTHIHPKEFKREFKEALKKFMDKFDSDSTFKNGVLTRFNNSINTNNTEITYHHSFNPFSLPYSRSSAMDSTGAPYRNIVISGGEEDISF